MVDSRTALDREVPDRLSTTAFPARLAYEIDFLAGRPDEWAQRSDAPAAVRARAFADLGDADGALQLLGAMHVADLSAGDLTAAVWAASRTGPLELAPHFAVALDGRPEFLSDGDVPLGPRAQFAALAAALGGRLEQAVGLLDDAVVVADRRSPRWGAQARYELGRILLGCLDVEAQSDRRHELAAESRGMLAAAVTFAAATGHHALLARIDELRTPDRGRTGIAQPGAGTLVQREDLRWTVGFGVQPPTTVRPMKGLLLLARLVDACPTPVPAVALRSSCVDNALPDGSDIRDPRARTQVTKLLRRTIDALSDAHPVLGQHLAQAVHTGYLCRYAPATEVAWHR